MRGLILAILLIPFPALAQNEEATCGFLSIKLPITKQSWKCEEKQEQGANSGQTYRVVTASGSTATKQWIYVFAKQGMGGRGGFSTPGSDSILSDARKWAETNGATNFSGLKSSPYPHATMNIVVKSDNTKNSCIYGRFTSKQSTYGWDREYAYVRYCEPGVDALSNQAVATVRDNVQFKQ